jgi:dolichol-phosphate mannosyltransferase
LRDTRAGRALRASHNWVQLAKFGVVGASGYAVNLGIYALLFKGAGLHYLAAGLFSTLVAIANNYWWNRHWTFRGQRGNFAYQGMRFAVVSGVALAANLGLLRLLVGAGVEPVRAQAIAIVAVTPLNFLGNKLWSFRK